MISTSERQTDIIKLISQLDISPTMYKNADDKYHALAAFLEECGIDTIAVMEFSLHIFDSEDWSDITDFKFEYPELEKYLSDTLLQYVRMGVDGFRFDVASLIPYSFFAYTFPLLRKENPDIFLLAETIHFSFGKYLRIPISSRGSGGIISKELC